MISEKDPSIKGCSEIVPYREIDTQISGKTYQATQNNSASQNVYKTQTTGGKKKTQCNPMQIDKEANRPHYNQGILLVTASSVIVCMNASDIEGNLFSIKLCHLNHVLKVKYINVFNL